MNRITIEYESHLKPGLVMEAVSRAVAEHPYPSEVSVTEHHGQASAYIIKKLQLMRTRSRHTDSFIVEEMI